MRPLPRGAAVGAWLLATATLAGGCAMRDAGAGDAAADDAAGDVADGGPDGADAAADAGADADAPDRPPPACPATQLAVGADHACAVLADHTLWCWGHNDRGQVGDGTDQDRGFPYQVTALGAAVAEVAPARLHTCARKTDGSVWCWGWNMEGELGNGTNDHGWTPVQVTGLPAPAAQVFAGDTHTCARLADGTLWCWGNGVDGELGDGLTFKRNAPVQVMVIGDRVADGTAGMLHTCARLTDGTLWCWGYNGAGALGLSDTDRAVVPAQVTALTAPVVDVSAGGSHTCAVTDDGALWCWGDGSEGGLGDGMGGYTNKPVRVFLGGLGPRAKAVGVGQGHTCAVRGDGSLWCFGRNRAGTVGDGTFDDRFAPVRVAALGKDVLAVRGGWDDTCALRTDGSVACWGHDSYGEIGDGHTASTRPLSIALPRGGAAGVSAGAFHTCAANSDGSAWCWGQGAAGALGSGDTPVVLRAPGEVAGLDDGVVSLAAGGAHSCARLRDGSVWCWGANYASQLGDGTRVNRLTPVRAVGIGATPETRAVQLAAADNHTCVLTEAGHVGCWGFNGDGAIGDGTTVTRAIPTEADGVGGDVAQISAGGGHTCAVKTDGRVWCWGGNSFGEIGDGKFKAPPSPVSVDALAGSAVEVAAGGNFTCARMDDRSVFCWGDNRYGQMNQPGPVPAMKPVEIAALHGSAVALAAGRNHACALRADGRVWCWGQALYGQTGDAAAPLRAAPAPVPGIEGAAAIAAGARHSCAMDGGGGLWCWGWNGDAQLGDGKGGPRPLPQDLRLCP